MYDSTIRLALGSTRISLFAARPLEHPSPGLCVPANLRGLMAAGLAGEVRMRAGPDVEDELLRHRPLSLGRAYRTGAGRLTASGIEVLAHSVSSDAPGNPARPGHAERGLRSALELLEDAGVRSVTLPIIDLAVGESDTGVQGQEFGRLLAGHLRRRSRLREVKVAGLDERFLTSLGAYLVDAGAHSVDDDGE